MNPTRRPASSWYALFTVAVLATACQPAHPYTYSSDPGDLRGDWLVVEVNDARAQELRVVVTFNDGALTTDNVCNAFTATYGYGNGTMQRLPRGTTVTYGGVGCIPDEADAVDTALLNLLYFNSDPIDTNVTGDTLTLTSNGMTALLSPMSSD